MAMRLPDDLQNSLQKNPLVSELLDSWNDIDLPNAWLVAGVVVQSWWNEVHGFSPLHGVSDADIIFFDPKDLSETAESAHASRINDRFANLSVAFDVKNEARVHLWYESKFGYSIPAYVSAEDAIDTFPTTAGSIGIRPCGDTIECYATFGFDDLMNLIVRPNKRLVTRQIYTAKTDRWRSRWPKLRIVDWDEE